MRRAAGRAAQVKRTFRPTHFPPKDKPVTETMATLLAKKFIQRRDAKAKQKPNGDYLPVAHWNSDGTRGATLPWTMADINSHLSGVNTYGHYLLDESDQCKLFAFDIDLEKNRPETAASPAFTGSYPILPDLSAYTDDISDEEYYRLVSIAECDPRVDWMNRAHPARPWLKQQLRTVAERLSATIYNELEIPTATAYSGSKGLHVYGFTGSISASAARDAAELVLQLSGQFAPTKGGNFYKHINQDPLLGLPNVSIEVFPKQSSLKGKDLGNLMRLPLGRNLKSPDPTFFVDQRLALSTIAPHPDPIALLESGNPWRD